MTVKGVTYTAPVSDFNYNPRPALVDEFVDVGAIESTFEIGSSCIMNTDDFLLTFDLQEITIYPNPFTDCLFIGNLPTSPDGIQIRITDILGRTVLNEQILAGKAVDGIYKIVTPGLRMGVYMGSIYQNNQFVKGFLLVNRNR
jgi:hypothetical protein